MAKVKKIMKKSDEIDCLKLVNAFLNKDEQVFKESLDSLVRKTLKRKIKKAEKETKLF